MSSNRAGRYSINSTPQPGSGLDRITNAIMADAGLPKKTAGFFMPAKDGHRQYSGMGGKPHLPRKLRWQHHRF